ncbi:MAG: hypothetical protein P8X63_12150 [Desulfuromonadaceae bacterium]
MPKRAVLRGVKVFLLIDGYGSKGLPRSMLDQLRADGVETDGRRILTDNWNQQPAGISVFQ